MRCTRVFLGERGAFGRAVAFTDAALGPVRGAVEAVEVVCAEDTVVGAEGVGNGPDAPDAPAGATAAAFPPVARTPTATMRTAHRRDHIG